jgi:zinc protease
MKLQGFPDYIRHVLPNGLQVLAARVEGLPLLSYQVHVAAGSRVERPGITGISHLFEHMMFKGTPTVGPEEFSRIIQANGGVLNAFTTTDHTTYYENLPADRLELAVRLEADRLANLVLSEENLEPEREVVRSERKLRSVNSPFGLLIEKLFALAYEVHPYRFPVIGWDGDLRSLTLEDCRNYYRDFYAPNQAVVVVIGEVEIDRALQWVEQYYGPIPAQSPPRLTIPQEPVQRGEKRAIFKKVSQVAAFFAGFHIPAIHHKDLIPLHLLCVILSGGRSSRFYEKFEKPGIAIEARAEMGAPPFFSMDPGLLQIYALAAPSIPVDRLEKEIWEEVDRLRERGPTPQELEKAKKKIRSALLRSAQTLFFKGLLAGIYQIRAGDFRRFYSLLDQYEAVPQAEILHVAQRYLTADNRTVVTLEPVSPQKHEELGELE